MIFFDKRNPKHKNFYWWLRYMRKLGTDKSPSSVKYRGTNKSPKYIKDYTNANSNGSMGIVAIYFLSDGVYDITERYKINKVRHYSIQVEKGEYRKI